MSWFVALPVEVGDWFGGLTPPADLRLEHRADLHLTLAFFGAIDPARARAAFTAARVPPVPITTAKVASLAPLGSPRRPSVVAALVESAELAAYLAKHRDALCDAAGVQRDARPPLPHITIARFDRRAARGDGIAWAHATKLDVAIVVLGPPSLYGPSPGPTRYQRISE